MSLYDTLGVPNDSTSEEIRAAYKDKAKKLHPDKGGSSEEMAEVNTAYLILRDSVKRDRYDKTGQTEEISFDKKFAELVNFVFVKLVEMEDERKANLVHLFKKQCFLHKRELERKMAEFNKKLEKFINAAGRLRGDGRIKSVLDGNIEELRKNVLMIKEEIAFLDRAIEVIDGYKYEVDDLPEPGFVQTWYITNG